MGDQAGGGLLILRGMFALVGCSGLLMLGFAVFFMSDTISMVGRGIQTVGRVVSSSSSSHGVAANKRTTYHAFVDYTLTDGRELRGQAEVHMLYDAGEEVSVYYSASEPTRFIVHHWFGSWWLAVLLSVVGLFLCYLGFAQFFR